MNQHIATVTPDFSDTTLTPVSPAPQYTPIVPKTNNDSLTPNADYVWEVNAEQRRKWEDSWQDNAETAGDEPDIIQTESNVRYTGLVSYVTSDLSPKSAELSKKIFGKTSTPYTGDSYSNLIVGRALCSMAGAKGNPVKFIREHGAQLNLSMPTAGYDTNNQLYTLIGSTFATKERDALTKRQQEAQAKAKEAEQRRADVLPDALTAMATGDFVTPLQRQVLDEVGFDALTVRRVRQLTQRTAPLATKDAPQTLQGDSILDGVQLLGLEHNTSLKGVSLFSTKGLLDASVIIGDDPIARATYLNLMRIAGRRHRDSHHSDSFFGNLGAATGNLLLSATRGVSEPFIKSGTDIGMGLAADLNEEDNINVKRYQALRADAEAAFQQGYQERSDELSQNLGSSILWQISDFPTTMAPAVSTTASFMSVPTSLVYFLGGNTDRRYEARANSMREGDTSTNFIEHGLVPTLKTGVEAASVYATGKSADLLIKGLGKTSLGKAVSARLAYSPKLSYAARVTEGVTTEITEELVEAVGNEAVELTGIVKDRQKEEHWTNFQKTFLSGEFWAGNVGMNLLFASFGYKGSRSKQPFKSLFDDLGFTKKEQKALQDDLTSAQQAGATPQQMGDIVKEHILKKESANPEEFKQKAINVMANAQQQQLIQEAAANGVRDAIIKQAGISDMVKDADGNIKLKRLSRAEDGKFEMVEETYTEEQLNSWLASNVESTLTQEIIDTQRTVRGEKVSRAVESSKNTPFSRVISMLNAPAELIAKMKDKTSFDEEAMQMFAEFALEEINSRISSGQSAEEARNAEFGTTGASLGSVANLASDFAKRISLARKQGDLKEDEIAQSNAFILPGRTPGDNILMIARGEASAKDIAHDWLESFGRARFYTNPSYWRAALDALDADLLNNGIIQKSLFDNAQGSRSDLEYIEVFSHLAEADWLASHDIYAVSDNTHNILDEVMDDLGAVQGGLETAKILKNYLASDAAKAAIGSAIAPLRAVLTKAGATLTDILTTAQESAPKDAADFVLRQRGYIQESTAQGLQSLGQEADSPAPLNTTTENPQEDALPPEASDGTPVTVADLAQMNGIDPQTGSVPAPPNATYSRKDPKKRGKNLIGGIAHGQPDGSICGAAKLADISIHPSIGKVDPANVRTNPDEKEVILFRKKDGTLQAIGGLSFLNHSTSCGVENVPVRVYSSGKKYTPQWAANFAMESKIRANLATTADLLSHFTKNNITRDKARRQNLIPKTYNGQELPSSVAAWQLLKYSSKKDIAAVISGKMTVEQALLNISPKVAKQKEQEQSLNTPQPLDPYASIFKDGKHSEASTTEPDVRTGQVPIASITHSPDVQQFKRTRGGREAKKDGVVNEIPGDYKTHDPIHLWLRTDGSLVVISGRHRLAKAIQSGAKYIPATVYPETETRNAQWARIHDFEQNVMDNQASVADIALYVQGMNPHGRKLTQEETEQFNRANSNAEKGLYIGLHGSPDLVYAHSINALSADYALKIAKAFPDDFDTQQQAIASLMNKNGITEALDSAAIYRDLRNNQSQELNFGDSQKQEAFNRFFALYAANKVKKLGHEKSSHKAAKTDKSIRKHEKVGIIVTNPEENRKELQRLTLEQDKWRNPGLYPELRKEAEEAFNNSEEAAQTYLNLDFSQQEQDLFSSSFSVTSKQAQSAFNKDGILEADNAIITKPGASFSITPARARRKYMPLAEAVKLEQYVALEEYARKLFRDAKRLTLANPKNRLDDATEAAIHLRSLLNAVFAILPKEARPWKALQFAKANIDALTWAVANPHLDLTPRIAPGLTPAEIDKYNESGWRDRRQWLTNKISKLIVSVADSAARSIEAHACRVLLQTAEDAIKTLDPKQQPSGKERRGTTSERVFTKALAYFEMFDWGPDKRAEELTKESDILNDPDASPEEHAEASRRRNAILLFAGLNKESLPRVKAGVETLLAYIQTGKEEWNKKLLEERRATEAIQEAISVAEPTISHSQTTARETRNQGRFKRLLTSFLNPVATLKIFASLPGKAGEAFTALRAKLAMAQDAKTYAINQAHRDAENALDDILGVTGKPAAMRDMARADFLTKANEYKKTGIIKKGRIKITKFELKPADVENLANIRNTQGIEAFNAALDTYRKSYSKEDKRQDSIPYEEVWNDILSQMKSPDYRGGTIYVEHYGQRDTDHVEELELTRLQAANLWLLAQQPSYSNIYDQDGKLIERGMLDILGYTDEIIDQLEIYCGKELIDYAIWKREYLNTTGLFEAYEEYMGLPFPKEENYWPGAFDTPSANGGLDAFNTTYEGNGVYSMLILRKKHLNEPNLAIDIEAAWEHAISQHFHYIHLSPLTRQIRAIMRDPDTKARMRKIAGRTPLDNLDVGLNALDGAPAMQLQAAIQANTLASRLWGSFAKALLNMATLTGIKQVSALGHALVHKNINIFNIVPKLITSLLSEIKGIKIGAITPSEIRKLPSFKIRKDRENLTSKASQLKPGQTQGKLALIDVLGGRVLEYSDYWANSVAMAAVYNTEYARAKKLMLQASGNKTLTPEQETELRQHCENTVSIALKQTAQPLEREDKPAALQQQNWAQMQNAFMMGEVLSKIACATSIYKSERAKAYGKSDIEKRKAFWRAIFKTYKYIGGMSMASQGILALLAYTLGSAPEVGDDDFDEWFLSQLLAGAVGFGYLTPLPVIGESVGGFGQYAFGQYGAFATYENTGIGASLKDLRDLEKAFNADKGAAERAYAGSNSLRWASALINFTLGGTKYGNTVAELFSAANNINNATRPALQYAKNTEKKSTKTKKSTLKKLQSAKKAATKSRYTKKVHKPTVDY